MSRFRRLAAVGGAAAPSGRDRRVACDDSCVPRFSAERLARGQSRLRLAADLCINGFAPTGQDGATVLLERRVAATEQLLIRIELGGQRAPLALVRALASVWKMRPSRAAELLASESGALPTIGDVLRLRAGASHAR